MNNCGRAGNAAVISHGVNASMTAVIGTKTIVGAKINKMDIILENLNRQWQEKCYLSAQKKQLTPELEAEKQRLIQNQKKQNDSQTQRNPERPA